MLRRSRFALRRSELCWTHSSLALQLSLQVRASAAGGGRTINIHLLLLLMLLLELMLRLFVRCSGAQWDVGRGRGIVPLECVEKVIVIVFELLLGLDGLGT